LTFTGTDYTAQAKPKNFNLDTDYTDYTDFKTRDRVLGAAPTLSLPSAKKTYAYRLVWLTSDYRLLITGLWLDWLTSDYRLLTTGPFVADCSFSIPSGD
jgi:hypothetical protein